MYMTLHGTHSPRYIILHHSMLLYITLHHPTWGLLGLESEQAAPCEHSYVRMYLYLHICVRNVFSCVML